MRAVFTRVAVAWVLALGVTATASAQSFTINLGYFVLKGPDARSVDDVLVADLGLNGQNDLPLFFEVKDFNGGWINGEFFAPIGDFLEAGGGIGFYRRTVPSVYDRLTFPNGDEIAQDLRLRIAPVTAAVKLLPLGRTAVVQPYVGAGLGLFIWRYSEIGDFIDQDGTVFSARYLGTGTAAGPIAVFGIRFPVGDRFMTGGEARWQKAEGTLPADQDFLAPKIDLGGWTVAWTLTIK
jgi:hypothetical protein